MAENLEIWMLRCKNGASQMGKNRTQAGFGWSLWVRKHSDAQKVYFPSKELDRQNPKPSRQEGCAYIQALKKKAILLAAVDGDLGELDEGFEVHALVIPTRHTAALTCSTYAVDRTPKTPER